MKKLYITLSLVAIMMSGQAFAQDQEDGVTAEDLQTLKDDIAERQNDPKAAKTVAADKAALAACSANGSSPACKTAWDKATAEDEAYQNASGGAAPAGAAKPAAAGGAKPAAGGAPKAGAAKAPSAPTAGGSGAGAGGSVSAGGAKAGGAAGAAKDKEMKDDENEADHDDMGMGGHDDMGMDGDDMDGGGEE